MTEQLLQRLDHIGASIASESTALALLGLGSVGMEVDRLDRYSDLDFFVVVDHGTQSGYLDSLDWMARVHPISYAFRNTPHGYKLMFEDGIYCEFAIFDPTELAAAEFHAARIVWADHRFDTTAIEHGRHPSDPPTNIEHLVGEALTNLYIGLLRDHRGERLAAMRMIQVHAIDRVMELSAHLHVPRPGLRDPFGNERRFEQRYPSVARELATFMQGYERNRQSAAAILRFLHRHVDLDRSMYERVHELTHSTAMQASPRDRDVEDS